VGGARVSRTRRRLVVTGGLLVLLVVATWAQQPAPQEVLGDEVLVIAHAGAQAHAPSNTIEGFDLALEQGAHVLEMDLQLTADGRIVVIHDGTVDRTTDGTGAVADLTLDRIQQLDAGVYVVDEDGDRPWADQGVTIPTLDEVLERYPDVPLNVELKLDGGEGIIQPVIDLVAASGRVETVTISSFDAGYLGPVRDQLPEVRTNMPEGETTGFYVRQLAGLHPWWAPPGGVFQVPEEHEGRRVVTPRFVRAAERVGATVEVWTVNEPEQMHRLLDAGVHGIMTDAPDVLVEVLDERAEARGIVRGPDPSRYAGQLERAERLQDEWSWLTPVLAVVTFLGDEEFYLLGFPLLYWAVSRRWGVRLGVMLLVTAGLNGVLKLLFATPRPGFLAPELAQVDEHSFGVPSGHSQNAAAIWGLLATGMRRRAVQVALVALILAIGWSRVHLGAHLLEDLLTGWLVGGLLVGAFLLLEPRVVAWWHRTSDGDRVLAGVVASLAMIAPATLLAGRLAGVSFGWLGLPDASSVAGASAVVTPAATLAGLVLGLVVLERGGGFDVGGPIPRRVVRVLVGFVGVIVLWQGLGAVLPGGEDPLALVLRYVRYALVGAWVGGLAPRLFVRLGLAEVARPTPAEGHVTTSTPVS
jgi:glycerophosphoryl diester phosphodiesterase/membrane-associated phospholipid phosphatase